LGAIEAETEAVCGEVNGYGLVDGLFSGIEELELREARWFCL